MPSGWYGTICCICFDKLDLTNAYIDEDGQALDAHKLVCAWQAGMIKTEPTAEEWERYWQWEGIFYAELYKEQREFTCYICGYYKDTPNHELGCQQGLDSTTDS